MRSLRFFPLLLVLIAAQAGLRAQATLPALKAAFSSRTLVAGTAPLSIHLSDYFEIPTVKGSVVQFDTIRGKFNAELLSTDAPQTVTNFLNYTQRGAYDASLVHRSVPGFVIQGGGFWLNNSTITPVTTDPAIQNEFKISNTRGTIAMAKTSLGPNTATSQWFINLADNSASLNTTNGGYTVFGRVLGTGMTIVDSIASIPTYDAKSQLGADFGELPLTGSTLVVGNLVLVHSVRVIPIYPNLASSTALLSFSATSSSTGVATVEVVASTLTLRPVAAGTTTITVRAVDTNGNASESSFTATVTTAPTFTTQPSSKTIAVNGSTTVSSAATTGATYQWQRNGGNLSGITAPNISIDSMSPSLVGLYTVTASAGGASTASDAAIIGISTSAKAIGAAREIAADIPHPNTNVFDQVLLEGSTGGITADYSLNQITRMSYIDLDDDIVQIEFGGHGTLAVMLDEFSGPAVPVKYNQPDVKYMKGHASIVITDADETTYLSIFTVGRATAYDRTGAYNILLAPNTTTNNPANNGSPLFVGHTDTTYDGVADLSRISILSTNGKFGGIRASNASFYDLKGYTGVYAPGVTFQNGVFVGDINAYGTATPVFVTGGVSDARVTGGDFSQDNGQPVRISGVTQLKFVDGSNSGGVRLTASKNQGILHQNGVNVTSQIVVNPQ